MVMPSVPALHLPVCQTTPMSNGALRILSLLLLAALTHPPSLAADTRRPITETALYAFQWIAGARISPDGSRVVYTQVRIASRHDAYETALWIVPTSGGPPRQLTSGPHDGD